MSFVVCRVAILLFMSAVWMTEVLGKYPQIRIILPDKIKYIHHHQANTERKYITPYMNWIRHQLEEDEIEEEDEESQEDAVQWTTNYYAIPVTKYSNTRVGSGIKPVFLYNDYFQRVKRPPRYENDSYEDYLQRLRVPETPYEGFDFK